MNKATLHNLWMVRFNKGGVAAIVELRVKPEPLFVRILNLHNGDHFLVITKENFRAFDASEKFFNLRAAAKGNVGIEVKRGLAMEDNSEEIPVLYVKYKKVDDMVKDLEFFIEKMLELNLESDVKTYELKYNDSDQETLKTIENDILAGDSVRR
ncbi:MAG: hypothetical protein Harvfovirus40_9 [Harvfovirus sp.]|uniref:Uncharacterized protein n=1 Tax=Harvfovirus sp. TaxID=2487768 RepID=A0A3G5A2U5_9VIRU|nr:MAG: hypothetical protein Harvfovirus40_9 [Harvfovirus sp.]